MKLFRIAFWLGVVICNLPSLASRPAAPESQLNRSQGLTAKAANRFCPQPLEPRASRGLPERGEPHGPNFSRDAMNSCQDTLTPADRAVQWRGRLVSSLLSVAPKGIINVSSSNIGGFFHFARRRTPMVSSSL